MSYADRVFVDMCKDVLENGTNTEGQKVRPHWEDGTLAYTIKKFGVVNRYDLRKEFPALTLRKTAIKTATEEMLWIYQRKSNNINNLDSTVWDEWADNDGSIGKAYGYQIGQKYIHHFEAAQNEDEVRKELLQYPSALSEYYNKDMNAVLLDQMDAVLYDLKHSPFSRRIMTNIWNFQDLHDMNLQPCCYSCTFNVTDEGGDKLVLNMILNQRSQDILAANNWNVCQFSILLMMVAQCVDMIPGELVHVIADAHIYDRHVPIIKELITREQFDAPKVTLNPDIKDFYKFTKNDVIVENYVAGPQVKNIPIAI